MESRQAIKSRIKSIQGTKQITGSMRLVSMAKLQRAREGMRVNAPFLEESRRLASMAKKCMDGEKHLILDGRPVENTLMIAISGDRGLCGGYNASVIRYTLSYLEKLGHPYKVITIGAKISDAFRRRQSCRPACSYRGLADAPIYTEIADIAEIIYNMFISGEVDQVLMCHTKFISMLAQNPEVSRLLPFDEDPAPCAEEYEPGGAEMLEQIARFYLASRLYSAILESGVSEQSARILSMDGASKTAGEMIASLTLRYNQARQAVITQELSEIVAGADAIG